MVMSAKEKKAFVARMKKGKKNAAKGKKKSGGKSKMIKVNKKALLDNLNLLESDLKANVAERISPDISQKSMSYTINRLKEQVKKM